MGRGTRLMESDGRPGSAATTRPGRAPGVMAHHGSRVHSLPLLLAASAPPPIRIAENGPIRRDKCLSFPQDLPE